MGVCNRRCDRFVERIYLGQTYEERSFQQIRHHSKPYRVSDWIHIKFIRNDFFDLKDFLFLSCGNGAPSSVPFLFYLINTHDTDS